MTSKKKIAASVGAVGMAAVIALGGTFAWQSISQTALNEAMDTINPGGRLHDDFNGRNKNVYVENFTTDGTAIFARVRLDEYMETQVGNNPAVPVVETTSKTDKGSWITRKPGTTNMTEDTVFGQYWDWNMGGQGVYMPTFNMDKDSLDADINGTYEGLTDGDATHYDDYKAYAEGEIAEGTVWEDADTDDAPNTHDAAGEAAGQVKKTENVEHTAALTGNGTVITMQEWIENGMNTGDFWVWDVDGWAYWANPIESGETTGLLLDEIIHSNPPSDTWYYGINVVGQFVTADDIGFLNDTGFYDTSDGKSTVPTANAELLLEKVTGTEIPSTTVTVKTVGDAATVEAGQTLQFNFEVTDRKGEAIADANVAWSVSGGVDGVSTIGANGLLTVGATEAADTELTVTATYTAGEETFTGTATVKVVAVVVP